MSFLELPRQTAVNWEGARNDRNVLSRSLGGQKSDTEVLAGPCTFRRRYRSLECPFPASGSLWPSCALLGLWLHHGSLRLCPHMAVFCVPLYALSSSDEDTRHVGLAAPPLQRDLILTNYDYSTSK